MNNSYIYHICTEGSWEEQSNSKEYIHDSLKGEGFIHFSEEHQIEGVLERYFTDQTDLLILTIEPSKIDEKVQYDKAPNDEDYPHIYGPINKAAIIKIEQLKN